MRVARVRAQAKINLFLQVVPGRDAQGYHEIGTLFHRVDLADVVTVRVGGTGRSIDCAGPQLPAAGLGSPEKNLAFRAALEFNNRRGWPDTFAIEIEKRIPVGGGMGGGSADAGGVLRALNAIAPQPLPPEELHRAGAALGSDVPFLATEYVSAIGTGRGTTLADFSSEVYGSYHVLVVVPSFSISTADAYRWLEDDRKRRGTNQAGRLPPLPTRPPGAPRVADIPRLLNQSIFNDFEPVVEAHHPEIRAIRERLLERGAVVARLAGSGSCVWGFFEHTPPTSLDLGFDAQLIPTRLSEKVVQVEVLE